jgi:hypothetical protein
VLRTAPAMLPMRSAACFRLSVRLEAALFPSLAEGVLHLVHGLVLDFKDLGARAFVPGFLGPSAPDMPAGEAAVTSLGIVMSPSCTAEPGGHRAS